MGGKRNKKSNKKLVQREKSTVDSKESNLRGQADQGGGSFPSELRPDHLADLKKSGLLGKTVELMGVRSLEPEKIAELLGWSPPGVESALAFPYPGVAGFSRLKAFPPCKSGNGDSRRYLQPKGSSAHLYVLPQVETILKDPSMPLALAEGEKKAAALVQWGIQAVGIGGIWCWRDGDTHGPIPELDQIAWVDRKVTLYFDSDIWHRPDLLRPVYALGKELEDHGAEVKVAVINQSGDGKVGVDDLLADQGSGSLGKLNLVSLSHNAFGSAAQWWKSWKGRKGRKGEAEVIGNGEIGLEEQVHSIRKDKDLWWFEKNRVLAEVATDHLRKEGAFYFTSDRHAYFFDQGTHQLLELKEKEDPFIRFLADVTGLNPTEQEFKYLFEHLRTETYQRGKETQVYHLGHYDQASNRLFVTDFGSGMWVLDGRSISHANNGGEGVLFKTPSSATPFTYLPKEQRPEKTALRDFLEMISFDPDASLSSGEYKGLLRIWLLSLFFPELHPTKLIPILLGPNGSTKTTTARRFGMLILGPGFNVGHLETERRGEEAFIATVCGKPFAAFDNADSYIKWLPDRLATFATGQVFELRELYTTNNLSTHRPTAHLMLTSREPRFRRPDVAERLLICRVGRPKDFIPESGILNQTLKLRDGIWSNLLDELNQVLLALQKELSAPRLNFRMADFASFGWRLTKGVGGTEAAERFYQSLRRLEEEQAQYATEDDPVAACLELWLATESNYGREIATGVLYKELKGIADEQGNSLPKTAQTLGKRLRLSKHALELELKIKISPPRKTTHTSWWVFSKPGSSGGADPNLSPPTLPTQPTQPDGGGDGGGTPIPPTQTVKVSGESNYSKAIVSTDSEFAQMMQTLEPASHLVVDLETTGVDALTDGIVGIGLCVDDKKGFYVPVGHLSGEQLKEAWVLERLKPLLEGKEIVGHNLKFEFEFFKERGIELHLGFDTMLADYLLDENNIEHDLKEVGPRVLGVPDWSIDLKHMERKPIAEVAPYCIEDVIRTWQLYENFKSKMDSEFKRLYYEIELPLIPVLAEMELHGYPIDLKQVKIACDSIQSRLRQPKEKLSELAGPQFNPNSSIQLCKLLYEELKLPIPFRTKSGKPSTDGDALESLRGKHRIIEPLMEYREIRKWLSGLQNLQKKYIHPKTGRVHADYHQFRAMTGRLISAKPNIQAVPRHKDVRKLYVAGDGRVLVKVDYAAQEIRILAHCSGDEGLLKCFSEGVDPHSLVAMQLYGLNCPVEKIKTDPQYQEQRQQAKTIQMGIVNRQGVKQISQDLGIPQEEAQRLLERYYALHPKVKKFQERMIQTAREQGYVEDGLVGRKRRLPQLKDQVNRDLWHEENEALNFPIQSLGATLLKLAMIKCHQFIKVVCPNVQMVASRHDELHFLVPTGEETRFIPRLKKLMEEAGEDLGLSIPAEVEIQAGKSWGETTEWKDADASAKKL